MPLLSYSLPKGDDSGTPGWPSFQINKLELDVATYLKDRKNNKFSNYKIINKELVIAGFQTLESSIMGKAVFDFSGGGSAVSNIKTHEYVLDLGSSIIICSMTTGTKDHDIYLATLRKLCLSMNVKTR